MEHPSMNERIKELALVNERIQNFFETGPVQRAAIEEFAELIVIECAMFVVTELEGKVGSAIADATANRLEEHFGVEETE
jgi:hypothetical protein